MKFKDPLEIVCPLRNGKAEYAVNKLLNRSQACIFCGGSFREISDRMWTMLNDWGRVLSLFGLMCEIEEKYSIKLKDEEVFETISIIDFIKHVEKESMSQGISVERDMLKHSVFDLIEKYSMESAYLSDLNVKLLSVLDPKGSFLISS